MPLILPVVGHMHSVSFLSWICTCAHTAAPAQKWLFQLSPPCPSFLPPWKIYMLFFSSSFMQRPWSPVDPLLLPLHSQSLYKHSWQEVDGRVPSNKSIPIRPASRAWVSAVDTLLECVCVSSSFSGFIFIYIPRWLVMHPEHCVFLASFLHSSWLLVKETHLLNTAFKAGTESHI